jgi:Glycosyl transferase family 2
MTCATGTAVTGTAVTGTVVTGTEVTGTEVTGTEVTGTSAVSIPSGRASGGPEASSRPGGPGSVSVVICVYTERRWVDILGAVKSVCGQSLPAHEIIVVVDHNPTLERRLIAEFAASGVEEAAGQPAPARAPSVSVVANREQQGLSGGKNTGVAVASGDIVAFLDDDAIADRDWLKFLADSYADVSVAGVGGLTLPSWDTRRPGWFPREFDWVVGCNYLGMPESRQPVRNLLGGNASFRAPMFAVAGGFTTDVGRSAASLPLGGEETEFCIKLRQRRPDVRLLIDHRAVIRHRVPAERCRLRYFLTRCYAEGLSKAQVSDAVGAAQGMAAERRHAAVALPAGVANGLAAGLRGDSGGFGRAGAIAAGLATAATGYAIGRLRVAVRDRPPGLQLGGFRAGRRGGAKRPAGPESQ